MHVYVVGFVDPLGDCRLTFWAKPKQGTKNKEGLTGYGIIYCPVFIKHKQKIITLNTLCITIVRLHLCICPEQFLLRHF